MISENNSLKVFLINIERTNMLIQAVDKIGAYNFLYQEKAFNINSDYGNLVKSVQNEELLKISNSCSEHAIISIATTFETYLKELLQEVLFKYGDYFTRQNSIWKENIIEIIEDLELYDYELILAKLKLYNRLNIIDFFKKHQINLLTPDQENLIKAIYIERNNFVHNGSTISRKTQTQIDKLNQEDINKYLDLSIKWKRTKFSRMIHKVHKHVFEILGG